MYLQFKINANVTMLFQLSLCPKKILKCMKFDLMQICIVTVETNLLILDAYLSGCVVKEDVH